MSARRLNLRCQNMAWNTHIHNNVSHLIAWLVFNGLVLPIQVQVG